MQSGSSFPISSQALAADLSDMRSDPPSSSSSSDDYQLTDADRHYCGSWTISNARFAGGLAQGAYLYNKRGDINYQDSDNVSLEGQTSALIGSGTGLILGYLFHKLLKKHYKRASPYNPLYRVIDTAANWGYALGETLGYFLPFVPQGAQRIFSLMLGDVLGFTFGLFAFPYWLIREKVLKKPITSKHDLARLGSEGWSRYCKTGLVIGRNAGQIAGFTLSPHDSTFKTTQTIGEGGAIGATGGFLLAMAAVPLINKLTGGALLANETCNIRYFTEEEYNLNKAELTTPKFPRNSFYIFQSGKVGKRWNIRFVNHKGEMCILPPSAIDGLPEKLVNLANPPNMTDQEQIEINRLIGVYYQRYTKNLLRNNYIRSGIALGLAMGSVIGFFIGLAIPVIGPFVSFAIFGAMGSLTGGLYMATKGHQYTQEIHRGKTVENTWDYTTRGTATQFAAVGTIVGLFIPLPGAALVGAAVGAMIGWGVGLRIPRYARKLQPIEEKSQTISWTFRSDLGSNVGMVVGGVIGLCAGLCGGPLAILVGISLGIAIGSIVGSAIGILYEKSSRKQIVRGMKSIFGLEQYPKDDENSQPSESLPLRKQPAIELTSFSSSTTRCHQSLGIEISKSTSASLLPSHETSTRRELSVSSGLDHHAEGFQHEHDSSTSCSFN